MTERRVRLIEGTVDYKDGSEQEVLDVLDEVVDRSSGSDELAGHIHDWPTRYHFSPERQNLLRPIQFGPGMRVLDVGAGTGALARHIAEAGASVVALEGSPERAEAVARRCAELDNVEVVCGPLSAYHDSAGFDVVVCVGVLEHTAPDHVATLDHLRRLTRPDGVLALAIENQLGLRYLLGYAEDHLLEPWAGVEGYPGTTHVRTFSKERLGRLLTDAGFSDLRWLFPFPDYKLPTVVVAESAYKGPDGPRFVDQLVRWPCSGEASPPARLCDERLAHAVLLDADLGPQVANSFLVLAGDVSSRVERFVDPGTIAWYFGSDRLSSWRSSKSFSGGGDGRAEVLSTPPDRNGPPGWLKQQRPERQPFYAGQTLEQRFLEACLVGRTEAEAVLRTWREHLAKVESRSPGQPGAGQQHPFRHPDTQALLPSDHLDVNLSNFVDSGGELVCVDAEWVAPSGVDADLVSLRALWGLAVDLVRRGVRHPWPDEWTVDELAQGLCAACGTAAGPEQLRMWRAAEAELLSLIRGGSAQNHLDWLRKTGELSHSSNEPRRALPFMPLRRSLAATQHRLAATQVRLTACETEADASARELAEARLQAGLATQALEVARRDSASVMQLLDAARRAQVAAEAAAASSAHASEAERQRAATLAEEVGAHVQWRNELERRYPVRLYRWLRGHGRLGRTPGEGRPA